MSASGALDPRRRRPRHILRGVNDDVCVTDDGADGGGKHADGAETRTATMTLRAITMTTTIQ
eukprot:7084233-Lingulodinium_polyedra.AAC.1